MKLKITVTQEDIDRGLQASHLSCPIALAFKCVVTGHVEVCHDEVVIGTRTVPVPRAIHRFIEAFDSNRNNVRPATFQLGV